MATSECEDAASGYILVFFLNPSFCFSFMLKHLLHMAEKKKKNLISIGEDKRVFWIKSSGPTWPAGPPRGGRESGREPQLIQPGLRLLLANRRKWTDLDSGWWKHHEMGLLCSRLHWNPSPSHILDQAVALDAALTVKCDGWCRTLNMKTPTDWRKPADLRC